MLDENLKQIQLSIYNTKITNRRIKFAHGIIKW